LALPLALCDGVHCMNLGQGQNIFAPFGGPFVSSSKNLTYLITKKTVEIASGLLCLENRR